MAIMHMQYARTCTPTKQKHNTTPQSIKLRQHFLRLVQRNREHDDGMQKKVKVYADDTRAHTALGIQMKQHDGYTV